MQTTTRTVYAPSAGQRVLNEESRAKILGEFNTMAQRGTCTFHDNQVRAANHVVNKFTNSPSMLNAMVIARTQSGKTGIACAVIKQFMENADTYIPIENIYIITGVSSKEWIDQTKSRVPAALRDRVFHRPTLKTGFIRDMKHKKNVLIIMDEVQIAANKNQTLDKVFTEAKLHSIEHMLQNDIKLIEITATPDGTCFDLNGWTEQYACKILVDPGPGYVSSYDILLQGRIRQAERLENPITADCNPFIGFKADVVSFTQPKYHIVRVSTYNDNFTQTLRNLVKTFGQTDYKFLLFDQSSKQKDINSVLTVQPTKHTFILIKETLRCAKSLYKAHLGVLYERIVCSGHNSNSVMIQSLLGRCTGYDDNGESIIYTDIESIEKYEELWNSGFSEQVEWRSNTTKVLGHCTIHKDTYLHIDLNIDVNEL